MRNANQPCQRHNDGGGNVRPPKNLDGDSENKDRSEHTYISGSLILTIYPRSSSLLPGLFTLRGPLSLFCSRVRHLEKVDSATGGAQDEDLLGVEQHRFEIYDGIGKVIQCREVSVQDLGSGVSLFHLFNTPYVRARGESFARTLGKLDDTRARIERALTQGKTYLRPQRLPKRKWEAWPQPAMRLLITAKVLPR